MKTEDVYSQDEIEFYEREMCLCIQSKEHSNSWSENLAKSEFSTSIFKNTLLNLKKNQSSLGKDSSCSWKWWHDSCQILNLPAKALDTESVAMGAWQTTVHGVSESDLTERLSD